MDSLNTPKHFTNIVTPKPLRQYLTPQGLESDDSPTKSNGRPVRNSPRKVGTPNYQEDDADSGDEIADETYEDIVGSFQSESSDKQQKVVKKVDPAILDNMNIDISKNTDEEFNEITKSGKKRGKTSQVKAAEPSKVDVQEDGSTDDDDLGPSSDGKIKIIRMGTEEVKKYALINKDGGEEDDDDDDFDREDREELYDDEVEAMENDPEAKAYLDSYCLDKTPEVTTLKVAKKYPSKQKFPCPKCPKIWNWPWELRRHLMIHFKPQKLNIANSFPCPHEGCDRRFQWKRDMKQHERIHTGDKLLVCSVCDKKFTTRQVRLGYFTLRAVLMLKCN